MSKEINDLLKQTGTTAALLAGAIATCGVSSPLVVTVLGGILTNIASNKIEQSKLLKLNEILSKRNPDNLNHNLEKLTEEAMLWAVKNIFFKYEAYCLTSEQQELLKKTKKSFITDLEKIDRSDWRTSEELIHQIDKLSDETNLIENLIVVNENWPVINEDKPFPQYFKDEFIDNFRLCFGELLKDKDHQPALKAYNRNVSTQIQSSLKEQSSRIDHLLEGNAELKQEIKRLSATPIEKFEQEIVLPQINISLDEYLKPLHENVALLVDQNGNILAGIIDLQKESKHQTQQIRDLGDRVDRNLKNKFIFIALPVLALALAYFAYSYWQSTLPFIYTVSVDYLSDNTDLPINEANVSITFGDKTETMEAHNHEAIFKGLPSFVRGDSVKVKINSSGFYTIDTNVIAKNILNVSLKRDDTYATMKGRVKDSNSGLPIYEANVSVQNIKTKTDVNGYYEFILREAQQKTEQRLIISKEGYQPWERIEPVIKNTESIIQLDKL